MRLRILDEAEAEMREAAQWYERQQRTLGHVFRDAMLLGFDEIERHPQRFSHPPGTRSRSIPRYLSANFSYSMIYEYSTMKSSCLRWHARPGNRDMGHIDPENELIMD